MKKGFWGRTITMKRLLVGVVVGVLIREGVKYAYRDRVEARQAAGIARYQDEVAQYQAGSRTTGERRVISWA